MNLPREIAALIARRATYASRRPAFDFFIAFATLYPDTGKAWAIVPLLRHTTSSTAVSVEMLPAARWCWEDIDGRPNIKKLAELIVAHHMDELLRFIGAHKDGFDHLYTPLATAVLNECIKQKRLDLLMNEHLDPLWPYIDRNSVRFVRDDDHTNEVLIAALHRVGMGCFAVIADFMLRTNSLHIIYKHIGKIGNDVYWDLLKTGNIELMLKSQLYVVQRRTQPTYNTSLLCAKIVLEDPYQVKLLLRVATYLHSIDNPMDHPLGGGCHYMNEQEAWRWYMFTYRPGAELFNISHEEARTVFADSVSLRGRVYHTGAEMAKEYGATEADATRFLARYMWPRYRARRVGDVKNDNKD